MSKERDNINKEIAEISAEFAQQDEISPLESHSASADYDFSLKKPFLSNRTIEELLEEGYIGIEYDLVADTAFAAAAHKFKSQIKWTRTQPGEEGNVALMTLNLAEFDRLLEFMLDKFGWCPPVYSNEESPDIFIFTPQNDLEKSAIALTTDGDCGWKRSLYSLDYVDTDQKPNVLCFIFATKPKDTQEQEWLLVQIDRKENSRSWSVHPGTLEQVYYIWAEEIGISEPNYKPTADEILDALQSLDFPKIIKDFLSTDYPDCIKDIFGENYGFISEQKLLSTWEDIQANGKEQEIVQVATKWANFVKRAFSKQLSYSELTKLEIFEHLNLSVLSYAQLINSNDLGFAINSKGEQLSETNTDDWLLISNKSYEIIRILMVEMIWQTRTVSVFWKSEAEIVSQEPEVIKTLIEEIIKNEDVARVCDLEIKGNSIFFNSGGYGCYGTYFEDEAPSELFEKLFERYDDALFAFEHVHPCQGQGYHFNSQWAKPEGEVDWDDETTYAIYRRMVAKETELDEGEFDYGHCWHIELDTLERRYRQYMPMLYALVQKAKAEGFDDWGNGEIGWLDATDFISYDIVCDLVDKYWDEKAENGESIYSPFDDIDRHMAHWVIMAHYSFECEFEMPDDFPLLTAVFNQIDGIYQF